MCESVSIDLLRHGEPVGGRRYRGGQDDPLSEAGWRQMEAAVADEAPWDHVVTSPLARCREFARVLAARQGASLQEEPRFREIGFGAWEGRSAAELRREDPHCLRRFYHDPLGGRPAGAEPVTDFLERVRVAWEALLRERCGERVLVVAHAGVMRAVIAILMHAPAERLFRIHIGQAALLRIRGDAERPPALKLT